jgi:hypothetical protein
LPLRLIVDTLAVKVDAVNVVLEVTLSVGEVIVVTVLLMNAFAPDITILCELLDPMVVLP